MSLFTLLQDYPIYGTSVIGIALLLASVPQLRNLGLATTKYYHASEPLTVTTHDGKITNMAELCKAIMPACWLNPLLFNGHLQTLYTALKHKSVHIFYKRHIFGNDDPTYTGTFAVDFVTKPHDKKDSSLPPRTAHFTEQEFQDLSSSDTRPMLVVLHGLSGGSHELYLRHVLALLVGDNGWEACVVNSRGCARSKLTSSVLYNARATWDIRHTVKWLRKTFPSRPLFGCGFSLGANIITNYIGEEGQDCVFKAAVILSNPWELSVGSLALQRTWFRRTIYSKTLGSAMKVVAKNHADWISQVPGISLPDVLKCQYLHEFDRLVQCPTWGYPTEGAYYRDASSVDSLLSIRVPFLVIHAEDDPVTPAEALPYQEIQQTPFGVLCTTSCGGHLAWFEVGGGRWFAKAVSQFLQKMAKEVNFEASSKSWDLQSEGHISRKEREPLKPVFEPMRRKMYVPGQ